jgi:hypothetical protein
MLPSVWNNSHLIVLVSRRGALVERLRVVGPSTNEPAEHRGRPHSDHCKRENNGQRKPVPRTEQDGIDSKRNARWMKGAEESEHGKSGDCGNYRHAESLRKQADECSY